jgi:hypothetical protein
MRAGSLAIVPLAMPALARASVLMPGRSFVDLNWLDTWGSILIRPRRLREADSIYWERLLGALTPNDHFAIRRALRVGPGMNKVVTLYGPEGCRPSRMMDYDLRTGESLEPVDIRYQAQA